MIGETGKPAHIFVSHCHQPDDLAWCKTFVETLRAAALDVWCDQHNLGNGALGDVIAVSPQTPRKRLNTRLVFCAPWRLRVTVPTEQRRQCTGAQSVPGSCASCRAQNSRATVFSIMGRSSSRPDDLVP